jgi:hypothetical protein
MENKNEKDLKAKEAEKKQISILRSGNTAAIINTIDEIREAGTLTILPEIFELMLDTEDDEVMEGCTNLLNDLKQKEAVTYLVAALKNQRYRPIRATLISSCWQSGLDFHTEVPLFTRFLLREDYATAIEAFTVIENSIGDLSDEEIVQLTSTLNTGIQEASDNKKKLIREMITVIRKF